MWSDVAGCSVAGRGPCFDAAAQNSDDGAMNEGIGTGHSPGVADPTAGDGVVTAEWRRIQRESLADTRAEAGDEPGPAVSTRRVPWRSLATALVAGVAVAMIANHYLAVVRETESGESAGETARLGILSRPIRRPEPTEADPAVPATEQATEGGGPEVFVPVPEAAVGPPQVDGPP